MTRTLVYLSGEPGVGKTTLMRLLTCNWVAYQLDPDEAGPARILYEDHMARLAAVELGRRREFFSGTDALPQTVITAATDYLTRPEHPLLLAEGARLANRRFLCAAVDGGWRVVLLHLVGEELAAARRAERAAALGVPLQNAAWVKGRRTASANLAVAAPDWGVQVTGVDAARLATDPPYAAAVMTAWRTLVADTRAA